MGQMDRDDLGEREIRTNVHIESIKITNLNYH